MTRDAVVHFAWGIGDDNPMWHDDEHARRSPWGGRVAPGVFAYAVDETTVAPGHDHLRRVQRSVRWTWFDVLAEGRSITAAATLVDETADGRAIEQRGRVEFHGEGGELLAVAEVVTERTDEPVVPIEDRPELRYSGEEIDSIEQAILAETRRGSFRRHGDGVVVGDELGAIRKGPLSIMDVVAWCAGTQGVATPDDGHGEGGLHAETATGPQQVSWLAQLFTDWAGDDSFLHRLRVDIDANPPLGSTITITGRVTATAVDGDVHLAELSLEAHDQGGLRTAVGDATVLLPSVDSGPVCDALPRV